jgi:hypothetical protein
LTLIYWWVKFHPESHFSQEVKRLFAVYLLTVEPEKVLDEVVDPPQDRPTRLARASKRLKKLAYGDHIEMLGAIFTIVAVYLVKELRHAAGEEWTHDPSQGDQEFGGAELHPMNDDPQGEGGGFMLVQLSLTDGAKPRWLLLKRYEYTAAERDEMYAAAKAYGRSMSAHLSDSSAAVDRTPFRLDTVDGKWAVSTIGNSQWVTSDEGAYFPESVRVAHVLALAGGLDETDPNSVLVWFDGRDPGTAGDWLGIGQVVDPQTPQVFEKDSDQAS